MMVLEFGFDAHGDSNYAPHNHKKNCVVYPGTHDNETLVEWFSKTDKDTINYVCEYLNVKDIKDGPISMIRAALGSIAEFAIIMYSDWLELGAFARFNEPNTDSGNWVYRFTKDDFSEEMIDKIAFLTKTYRRNKKIIS